MTMQSCSIAVLIKLHCTDPVLFYSLKEH